MTQLLITHVPCVTANNTMSFLQLHHWYMVLLESLKSCHVIDLYNKYSLSIIIHFQNGQCDSGIPEVTICRAATGLIRNVYLEACKSNWLKLLGLGIPWHHGLPRSMLAHFQSQLSIYLWKSRAAFCKTYVLKEPKKYSSIIESGM